MLRRLVLFALATVATASAQPPNVLLILADDLGWADAGCYGNTYNETPHLDRLAREGMRFTHFYAGPVCSPTRANLQSGRDQARYGITQHIPGHRRPWAKLRDPVVPLQLPLEVETFAERLAGAGYRTGFFGKWHLGGRGFSPADQGWQVSEETKGNIQKQAGGEQRTAAYLTEKAIAFLQTERGRPFVLQVAHNAVHIPLSTTPEHLARFGAKPAVPGYPSRPEYAGLLAELDDSVGRLLDALDQLGLAENTLVFFVSDNGGLEHEQNGTVVTSNRPLRGEKGSLYEGGIRVPAIARWPGRIPAGTVCHVPAITTDLHATFAELAGVKVTEGALDGVSLTPLLADPAARLSREALFWHLPHYHHSTPASAVRQGDWKLIEFFEDDHAELYDLAGDPAEMKNLAETEPARTSALRASLQAWRQRVGARMPVPNPDYDPARAGELGKAGRDR